MEELRLVGLFRTLSNVELAKLVPLVDRITVPQGTEVGTVSGEEGAVCFILQGSGELISVQNGHEVSIAVLSPGDAYGRLVPEAAEPPGPLRARTELHLARIRAESFYALCQASPEVESGLVRWMADQLAMAQAELTRSRRMLSAYAAELWYTHDQGTGAGGTHVEQTAATSEALTVPVVTQPDREPAGKSLLPSPAAVANTVLTAGPWLCLLGLHAWAYLQAPPKEYVVLALLIWGAASWFLNRIPDYGVALAMVASAAAMALAPLPTVLSGFTNTAYFLLLGIYGMGAAIQRTGLLYRFALFMLRKLPPTYGGQAFALALTGLLLTPILPSANGRITIASPLVQELAEAMRLRPRSAGSSGLLLAALHGFAQMFFLFMSGGTCMVLWGLLPHPYRSEITWVRWLLLSLPLGALVFIGFLVAVYFIPGARASANVSRQILDVQMATLGPMSRQERLTLALTGLIFALFVTQPLHGIDPAWPAMVGVVVLLTSGVIDRNAFLQKIDWTYLAFFGAVVGFAELVRYVHLDRGLGQLAQGLLAPVVGSPVLFLGAVVLLTYLVRVAIPWSATVPLVMLAITPVVLTGGYHPFIAGVVVLAASNPFFLPNQNLLFLNAHSGTAQKAITLQTGARYGWIQAAVVLVAVLLTAPIWQRLGLTP